MNEKEKSKEELLKAKWEELSGEERSLQYQLETYPELTLEEAKSFLDMIP